MITHTMNLLPAFKFLTDLKSNNNRDWFKDNNERYQEAKSEFEKFIEQLIPELRKIDNSINVLSPKECMFRIFRDVRFSKNKEPYKTNFGAVIAKGGRKSQYAGYYVHFEPDNSFLGGGIYMPQPAVLKAIRNEIFENSEEFKRIIYDDEFIKVFQGIFGEKLKKAPRGFPANFPDIDLLKHKHYAVAHKVENSFWFEENLLENTLAIFKTQYNFNRFLNNVILHTG